MIPFVDLKSQYAMIQSDVETAVLSVLRGGQYIQGPEVLELEGRLSAFTGTRHAVSCASGTDALVIALMALGVGAGDAVFVPTFTFMATAEAVALVGAVPIFVDIDPDTFNIDPVALSHTIRALRDCDGASAALPRLSKAELRELTPRAVIAVDLFGLPADYSRINDLAEAEGLVVIEDAAQSFGASVNGKRAGALAPIACTSFFPAKPLGCYGDGGAIFTDDDDLAEKFRSIRVHGQGHDRYENVRIGLTGRLDTIQAAVLLQKLKVFEGEFEKRDWAADLYSTLLSEAGVDVEWTRVPIGSRSAWAQYTLKARDREAREALRTKLEDAQVPSVIYYPKPLHLQSAFGALGYTEGDFPHSEDCCSRVFSLPMHPYLTPEVVQQVVMAMRP